MIHAVKALKILHLEDHPADADLVARLFKKAAIEADILVVETCSQFEDALDTYRPDVIISEHKLHGFTSLDALDILKKSQFYIPFILVTGTVSEEFAIEAMQAGVDDYILKDRMQRLPNAVIAVLEKFSCSREQREVALKISESEAKYRALFENSMDGMLLTIPDGRILAANPSACEMLQMTEKEICEQGRKGIIDPSDSNVSTLVAERHRAGRAKGHLTFVRKDTTRFPVELTSTVFTDTYGHERTSIIFRDITERKEAEQKLITASDELKQLNKRLTLATRSAGMGIWDWNIETGNLLWDEGMHQLYKTDANQFGSIYDGWLSRLLGEDKLRVHEEILLAMSGKKEYDTEFRIEWPDQSVRYIKATGVIERDSEGNCTRMIGMNWDITQAKNDEEKIRKSETLLRNIYANSLDVICTIDQGRFAYVSGASLKVWGYSPAELVGRKFIDFVFEEDKALTSEVDRSIRDGRSVASFENRYVRKDGSIVPLIWSSNWEETERIIYCIAKDATEIKKAERTIASERKRLYDLFMNAPVAMSIIKGKDHVFELANPIYLQQSGKNNVIGKSLREVFPEFEGEGIFKLLDNLFQTGESFAVNEMELTIDLNGDGDLTTAYQNVLQQPYRDADGNVEGIFYFGVDVTEQVKSRKTIEEAEQRYRQIVETAQEGIWLIDENEQTIFVNGKLCELLGYDKEEMIGKHIHQFMDNAYRNDTTLVIQNRRNGETARGDFKYISKSGSELWTNVSANPLVNEHGTYTGSLAMITDVTEQRKISEENRKLSMVASLTVNAVIVTDADGKISWVNKGFERITEFTFNEVLGKKPGDFLQGDDTDQETVQLMSGCIKEGKGFRVEILNYSKSGRKYWLDIEVVPLHDANNRFYGFMAIEQDISERRRLHQEMVALIENLEKKNKNLQQFSYIVSHNLRAPISKIMSLVDAIEDERPENQLWIDKILGEANQLDQIIRDLNTIIAARQIDTMKAELVIFQNKFKRVSQLLENEIAESHAKIDLDFSQAPEIVTIKAYLHSIFYNLLSNAIKYRNPSIPLHINIHTSQNSEFVCLSVSDNGLGINLKKNHDKVFGLYKRFHGTSIPGRGVGLSLVKTHTESLGGKIEIESEIDKGTTFRIFLPKNYGKDTE